MKTANDRLQPTAAQGALVGLLATTALMAILFLAHSVVDAAFVPFDLFDGLARVLPGDVIGAGIRLLVSIIAALNLEDTSRSAKTAEHILALVIMAAAGAAAGGLLFWRWRRAGRMEVGRWGIVAGLTAGAALASVSVIVNTASTIPPIVNWLWITLAVSLWGRGIGAAYDHLALLGGDGDLPAERAALVVMDRRRFMIQLGGLAATITLVGTGLSAMMRLSLDSPADSEELPPGAEPWSAANPLPNTDDPLAPAPGTRPEFTPLRAHYRIDINSLPPVVNEEEWKLEVGGKVKHPHAFSLDELRQDYEPLDQFVTLSCISNPIGGDLISTQRWTGVPLRRILEPVEPLPDSIYVRITSADGFDESISLQEVMADERIMLTYAWDGLPLSTAHGFPLRVYVPDVYGMKQPKWITQIEVMDTYEEGFWVRRGWDEVARVNLTSVVDTVAVEDVEQVGERTLVPIGGIAYAGARGISAVEVQVDGGEWQPAHLRRPLSDTTWVIWRYDWPFAAGSHEVAVRCVDGQRVRQLERSRGTSPSGATGIHRLRFDL